MLIDSHESYFYDFDTGEWTRGPDLSYNEKSSAAGIVIDSISNVRYVVVSGGCSSNKKQNNVEMLELPYGTEWFKGNRQ